MSRKIPCLVWLLAVMLGVSGAVALESPPSPEQAKKIVAKLRSQAARTAADRALIGEPQAGFMPLRGTKRHTIQLDRARCYTFLAVGDKALTDLSLTVTAYGKEVASDRRSSGSPSADWCAPGRVKVTLTVTGFGGSGPYALGAYGEKSAAAKGTSRVGGKETDYIANRLRQLYGQFGKKRRPVSAPFRGNLPTGKKQTLELRLEAGHCYTIIGTASPSVRNLDLSLTDRNGRELVRDRSKNSHPVIHTDPCVRATGMHTVTVGVFEGFGQYAVQVFSD